MQSSLYFDLCILFLSYGGFPELWGSCRIFYGQASSLFLARITLFYSPIYNKATSAIHCPETLLMLCIWYNFWKSCFQDHFCQATTHPKGLSCHLRKPPFQGFLPLYSSAFLGPTVTLPSNATCLQLQKRIHMKPFLVGLATSSSSLHSCPVSSRPGGEGRASVIYALLWSLRWWRFASELKISSVDLSGT